MVVLSYRNEDTILAAVGSLLAQAEPLEIVVSHSGGGTTPELLARRFPDVRVLSSEPRRLPGAARNAGVAATHAPYVAFLAADCQALPGWATGRLVRHRANAAAVASAMAPLHRTPAALAAHLLQHGSRMPHLARPPRTRYGVSYRRDVLERHGPFPEDLSLGEDTLLNQWLLAAGVDIVWAPEVVTAHAYPTATVDVLTDQYRRGRLRAGLRRTLPSRVLFLAQLLPEGAAAWARAARRGSPLRAVELLRAAPLVAAGTLAAVAGALVGSSAVTQANPARSPVGSAGPTNRAR